MTGTDRGGTVTRVFEERNREADARVRAVIEPFVPPGEELVGSLYATAKTTFSAQVYGIGVTAQRLIFVPLDRKMAAKGEVELIAPGDIVKSSVDGFGGGLGHFLTADWGDIRIDTASKKYKLMALGGGFDQVLVGEGQGTGKEALLRFLYAARNPS